jgi:hypothetical protein
MLPARPGAAGEFLVEVRRIEPEPGEPLGFLRVEIGRRGPLRVLNRHT